MPNNNCLSGIRCPKCRYETRFFIEATSIFEVYDNGTEGHGDVEWERESGCTCPNCGFSATVQDFHVAEETAALSAYEKYFDACEAANQHPKSFDEWLAAGKP